MSSLRLSIHFCIRLPIVQESLNSSELSGKYRQEELFKTRHWPCQEEEEESYRSLGIAWPQDPGRWPPANGLAESVTLS